MAFLGDSLEIMRNLPDSSIDLIFTSPPFALRRKKAYGNQSAGDYVEWFLSFAHEFRRILKDTGSLVVDIGGSWNPGEATKSLYHYKLLIALVEQVDFYLAQEVFWYNPARLPTPAQWVCIERTRLKDAVNMVWWLSKTPNPNADNRRVLTEYKANQRALINGLAYNGGLRPSEHVISDKFGVDNGGAIPPNYLDGDTLNRMIRENPMHDGTDNLLRAANTSASDRYLNGCKLIKSAMHPARIPAALPEFFIRFLTEPEHIVLDPFAGSNVTGAVAEGLDRHWIAIERDAHYLFGSQTRFATDARTLLTRRQIPAFESVAAELVIAAKNC